MTVLSQLFKQRQVGFTVYSPDCTHSRLWGNLDHAIHEATDFQPISRRWINHDVNSIMRFYRDNDGSAEPPPEVDPEEGARKYENVPVENLQYGHLVARLFLSGPSLLTLWHGENAVETLLDLKGATHPPLASPESIRGRFWCDNGVCNLLHVSDDEAEAERELRAIHLWDMLGETLTQVPLMDENPVPTSYIAHSGIVVACDVVNRILAATPGGGVLPVQLPPSGDAKETNDILTALLQTGSQSYPETPVASFIDAYLMGDVVTVTHLMKQMPVTKWEHFIIQCGAITRYKWIGLEEGA